MRKASGIRRIRESWVGSGRSRNYDESQWDQEKVGSGQLGNQEESQWDQDKGSGRWIKSRSPEVALVVSGAPAVLQTWLYLLLLNTRPPTYITKQLHSMFYFPNSSRLGEGVHVDWEGGVNPLCINEVLKSVEVEGLIPDLKPGN